MALRIAQKSYRSVHLRSPYIPCNMPGLPKDLSRQPQLCPYRSPEAARENSEDFFFGSIVKEKQILRYPKTSAASRPDRNRDRPFQAQGQARKRSRSRFRHNRRSLAFPLHLSLSRSRFRKVLRPLRTREKPSS